MTPCIAFPGKHLSIHGYGKIAYRGAFGVLAHRVAYVDAKGIPLDSIRGLVVRHKCDNPSCINPEHLELGTQLDNIRDTVERGRVACGSKQWKAKLDELDVRFIRHWKNQGFLGKEIASVFEVRPSAVSKILNGKAWKHA